MVKKYLKIFTFLSSEPLLLHEYNFEDKTSIEACLKGHIDLYRRLKVKEDGIVDTVILWFDLYLTDKIKISTFPGNSDYCRCWNPALFVFNAPPIPVKPNEQIDIYFQLHSSFKLISATKTNSVGGKGVTIENYSLPNSMIQRLNYQDNFTHRSVKWKYWIYFNI